MASNIADSYYSNLFKTGQCKAVIAELRQALAEEHHAVNLYQAVLDVVTDSNSGPALFGKYQKGIKTIEHIRDEEIDHEGELRELIRDIERMCGTGMGKHTTKIK